MKAICANIVTLTCEAIVNAANTSLLGGGGVDGAIHRAAGPELVGECRMLNGCKAGNAKITKGYRLSAKYVIHTVGPVWRGGDKGEVDSLISCYTHCLDICVEYDIQSVAFPCISTGIYRFPKDLACEIAVSTCREEKSDSLEITFCCFDQSDLILYERELSKI